MNDLNTKDSNKYNITTVKKQSWADITDDEEKNEMYYNECQQQQSVQK